MHTDLPLLNVLNGMLDLATGTLKPHDPMYLSSVQFPIEWNPEAEALTYLEWCESVGILDQLDDLEEVTSMMLDPSRTPTKAAFLFGPSRSGKSTYLRLMEAVAGIANVSGVSLKQLSDDKHSAANVYGKALNVSADLSSAHVEDLSLFKMMTGEDLITADRKFGNQFSFRNRALFAFSANELPTVGESSRAYSERIKPFRFGSSFAGHENPAVEDALRAELPGILARWVRAWQRLTARGTYLPTAPAVRQEFETRSDRVRQFFVEELSIARSAGSFEGQELPATPSEGQELPADLTSTPTELANMFRSWSEAANGPGRTLGRNKLIERLTSINGVVRVRREGTGQRCLNLFRRNGGDPWEGGEPAGDDGQLPTGESRIGVYTGGSEKVPATETRRSEHAPAVLSAVLDEPAGAGSKSAGENRQGGPEVNAQVSGVQGVGEGSAPPCSPGSSGSFGANVVTPRKHSKTGSGDTLPRSSRDGKKVPEVPTSPALTFDDDGAQALDAVLARGPVAAPYRPDPCPDCDTALSLVPLSPVLGAGFWYACRRCTPGTFDRV